LACNATEQYPTSSPEAHAEMPVPASPTPNKTPVTGAPKLYPTPVPSAPTPYPTLAAPTPTVPAVEMSYNSLRNAIENGHEVIQMGRDLYGIVEPYNGLPAFCDQCIGMSEGRIVVRKDISLDVLLERPRRLLPSWLDNIKKFNPEARGYKVIVPLENDNVVDRYYLRSLGHESGEPPRFNEIEEALFGGSVTL
jgi:hypothetical protein